MGGDDEDDDDDDDDEPVDAEGTKHCFVLYVLLIWFEQPLYITARVHSCTGVSFICTQPGFP